MRLVAYCWIRIPRASLVAGQWSSVDSARITVGGRQAVPNQGRRPCRALRLPLLW